MEGGSYWGNPPLPKNQRKASSVSRCVLGISSSHLVGRHFFPTVSSTRLFSTIGTHSMVVRIDSCSSSRVRNCNGAWRDCNGGEEGLQERR